MFSSTCHRTRQPHSPKVRSALRQIEHLARIQQPLELLHQLDALIAAALRIDEHQHRRHARIRYRLDDERARLIRPVRRGRLAVGGRFCVLVLLLAAARLLAQRRLEAAAARQLDDPRRRHNDLGVRPQGALLADELRIEAGLLVVVGVLAPGARQRYDLFGAEAQLRL